MYKSTVNKRRHSHTEKSIEDSINRITNIGIFRNGQADNQQSRIRAN